MRLIAAIVVLTLVAIGAGALAGLHLFAAAERAADAKKSATPPPLASSYAGSARLRKLSPIVTNLAAPANNWARIEASMVTESMNDEEAGILAAHISEDIVTYLRRLGRAVRGIARAPASARRPDRARQHPLVRQGSRIDH
nr:flagellar protein [Bradyrhizobium sp. 141]